jgi:hypothetical protein
MLPDTRYVRTRAFPRAFVNSRLTAGVGLADQKSHPNRQEQTNDHRSQTGAVGSSLTTTDDPAAAMTHREQDRVSWAVPKPQAEHGPRYRGPSRAERREQLVARAGFYLVTCSSRIPGRRMSCYARPRPPYGKPWSCKYPNVSVG